jgi:hypothetical protein
MLTFDLEYVMREVYQDRLREAENERLALKARTIVRASKALHQAILVGVAALFKNA